VRVFGPGVWACTAQRRGVEAYGWEQPDAG
jgi:hypothetical protein